MNLAATLAVTIIIFIIFLCICHYGIKMTLWASITFSSLVALLALNLLFPPSDIIMEKGSPEIVVYALFQIIGFINIFIFAFCKGIETRRIPTPCD